MSNPIDRRHNGGPALPAEPVANSTTGGWVAISRNMRSHYIVGFGRTVDPADPSRGFVYSRAEAWIDLIMECRYRDGAVMNGGHRMELKTGQLVGAWSWLAARWNWTPKTVRTFIERLEGEGMAARFTPGTEIRQDADEVLNGNQKGKQRGKQAQVITICNYSQYQVIDHGDWRGEGQAKGTQGASKGHAEGMNLTSKQINKETTTTAEHRPPPPSQAVVDDRFSCLNGTTDALVAFIARHAMMPPAAATDALATNVQVFGADAVNEAYAMTIAKMAAQIVPRPYSYMLATAKGLKERAATKTQKPTPPIPPRRQAEIDREHDEAVAAYEAQRRR